MTFTLALTQAPHASFRNGGYGADARQYWARPTQHQPNGPRIEGVAGSLAPGGFAPILVDNTGDVFLVLVGDRYQKYSTLDYTPKCTWDEATRQIIMGGFRERHKAIAFSDLTGDWREIDQPPWLAKYTGTGHFYGTIEPDSSGNVYWKTARYNPATEEWTQISAPVTPNGSNGSNYAWLAHANRLGWTVGDAQQWQTYNPDTDAWVLKASSIGSSQHAVVAYHPVHHKVLMVGGTYTPTTAILIDENGTHTQVSDCPGQPKMSTGGWAAAHKDGCWIIRTTDPTPKAYAYWPDTDTWQDLGAAPDAALIYSTAAVDYLRARVYIVATTGLYVWQMPAFSGSAAFINRVDAGDVAVIVGTAPVMAILARTDAGDVASIVASVAPAPVQAALALVDAHDTASIAASAGAAPTTFTITGAGGTASQEAYGPAVFSFFSAADQMEPVTLAEAKTAARLGEDETELDLYIEGVISAARKQAEQITGRIYKRRTERFSFASWPTSSEILHMHAASACEISYWDGAAWVAMDASAFEFAEQGAGIAVAPALDTNWPALGRKAVGERVHIDLTAGPLTPAEVEPCVKLYIKAQVSAWINNPDALAHKDFVPSPLLAHLLDSERLWA